MMESRCSEACLPVTGSIAAPAPLPKGRSSIPVSPFKMGWPAGADIKAGRHTTSGPIPAL